MAPIDGETASKLPGDATTYSLILARLKKHEDAYLFAKPVDWKKLGLTDYPEIIKKPMDLQTLGRMVRDGHFENQPQEFLDHLQLIWDNCKLYNDESTEFHAMAYHMEDATAQIVRDIVYPPLKAEEAPAGGSRLTSGTGSDVSAKRRRTVAATASGGGSSPAQRRASPRRSGPEELPEPAATTTEQPKRRRQRKSKDASVKGEQRPEGTSGGAVTAPADSDDPAAAPVAAAPPTDSAAAAVGAAAAAPPEQQIAEAAAPPAEATAPPAETTAPPAETTAPPAETTAQPPVDSEAGAGSAAEAAVSGPLPPPTAMAPLEPAPDSEDPATAYTHLTPEQLKLFSRVHQLSPKHVWVFARTLMDSTGSGDNSLPENSLVKTQRPGTDPYSTRITLHLDRLSSEQVARLNSVVKCLLMKQARMEVPPSATATS